MITPPKAGGVTGVAGRLRVLLIAEAANPEWTSVVDGLFVPARDPAAMADAIEKILKDPALALSMGASGAERVRRHFGSEVSAQTIAQRLGRVMDNALVCDAETRESKLAF